MKFHSYLSALGSLFLLLSCGDSMQQLPNDLVKLQTASIPMSETNLFDGSVVKMHVDASQSDLDKANQLFLEGLDLYRNQDKLTDALEKMKSSVVLSPSAKAYYEIGNIQMDLFDFEEALKAYQVAEELGYEPFSKVLYNLACVYSNLENIEMAGKYLEYALQAGYTNINHIQKDEDLAYLRDSYLFDRHLNKGIAGMSNAENLFWLKFKNRFPSMLLPNTLDQNIHGSLFKSTNYISYDYEVYIAEMRDEKFSREVSKGFYYYRKLMEQPEFVALVYIERDEFLGEYAPVTYKLATFSNEGKLIDKRVIAGTSDLKGPLKVCNISETGELSIKHYAITYDKDPDEYGFYQNPIVALDLVTTENWEIMDDGKLALLESLDLADVFLDESVDESESNEYLSDN